MMRTRICALLAALAILVGASGAVAVSGATAFYFSYELQADNTAKITGWLGNESVLHIPQTIDGHTVTAIGDSAFAYSDVHTVIVPATVRVIERGAFWQSALHELYLTQGVEEIHDSAFIGCNNLRTVVLPSTVTVIGEMAFGYTWVFDPEEPVVPGVVTVDADFCLYAYDNAAAITYCEQASVAYTDMSAVETGDWNLDGVCTTADVRAMLMAVADGMSDYAVWCDRDGDGVLTTVDARECLWHISKAHTAERSIAFETAYYVETPSPYDGQENEAYLLNTAEETQAVCAELGEEAAAFAAQLSASYFEDHALLFVRVHENNLPNVIAVKDVVVYRDSELIVTVHDEFGPWYLPTLYHGCFFVQIPREAAALAQSVSVVVETEIKLVVDKM